MKTATYFTAFRTHNRAACMALAGIVAGFFLAACETTGDPRQGGLFGWSETKAIERQRALRDQFYLASEENRAAQRRSESLRATESGLRSEVAGKSAQLDALRSEIEALRGQIQNGSIPASTARSRSDSIAKQLGAVDPADARKLEKELALLNERITVLSE